MGFFDGNHIANAKTDSVGTQGPPGVGFKQVSSGDYDMDNKILFNVKTQDDVPDDSPYETIKKDYGSAVNKEYLKNNFLKRDKTGVYFDLRGYSIQLFWSKKLILKQVMSKLLKVFLMCLILMVGILICPM